MYANFCCSFIYAAENGDYHDFVRSWQRCWKCFYSQDQALAHHIVLYSFIHSNDMCRMCQFLAILRSFFHSPLLRSFPCQTSPPTSLPSSLTSSCHLFLGLPLNLIVPKFIYNTLLGILFSSILCTCPNEHNLFNRIVSVIVDFFNHCINFFVG